MSRPFARPAVVAAAALWAWGCASPLSALTSSRELSVGAARFELRWAAEDAREQERVGRAVERAAVGLERWGGVPKPVTVHLVPGHDELERAVRRFGYGWLRAWAKYDDVVLQSPRTWSASGAGDGEVDELVLHELTHCLLFQRSAPREAWLLRGIPMWFREGMATWTAKQAYRFPSLEDLSRWLWAHPELDVFRDGDALSRDYFDATYGLSHHAFAFLVKRYGEAAVMRIMNAMQSSGPFRTAFELAVGLPLGAFERDFSNYVRLGGFRGYGLKVRPLPRPGRGAPENGSGER